MYRFRTIDSLLGKHKELIKQEIYFASPDQLNDPMEGFRDLFWKGDSIIWKNMIINYTKSVERIFALTILLNDDKEINDNDILVWRDLSYFKSPQYKKLIDEIIIKIFEEKFICELPEILSMRKSPIRRDEFLSYLQIIHLFILDIISDVYFKNGLTNKKIFNQSLNEFKDSIENLNLVLTQIFKKEKEENIPEILFTVINQYTQSSSLLMQYNFSNLSPNNFFLISEFPNKFVNKLETAIYPPWYSSSFLNDYTNSSIWGHYGDNHKGVCLKFKTIEKNNSKILNLKTTTQSGKKTSEYKFRKIDYDKKHVEIDFFRSIGGLTKTELNKLWYSDLDGNISICGKHLNENETEWSKQYWSNFHESISIKLQEWKYEGEHRLLIHGNLIDYSDPNSRKLKYDFKDLEGIIFGIKTQNSEKLKIIKIIEEKCKKENRKEFDFFQAFYSKESGKIDSYKLNTFKF